MKIKSNLIQEEYCLKDICRIVNTKQQMLYIKHGLYPIDIYTSVDSRTGKDVMVMIFNREKSKDLYKTWCDHELK